MTRSERIYRFLLKAYPKRYLERYEEPMAQLFSDQLHTTVGGARSLVLLWLRTLVDLLTTIPARYFDRPQGLSQPAMRAVFFARYTAAGLGHADITAEDILAGLLREDRDVRGLFSPEALDEIRHAVGFGAKPERRAASLLQMPFSDTVKKILSLAILEAERDGAKKIMGRHLAAGILSQGQTSAADLLRRNGISLDRLRAPKQ